MLSFLSNLRDNLFAKSREKEIEQKLDLLAAKLTAAVEPIQSTLDVRIRDIEALLAHVFAVRQDRLELNLQLLNAKLANIPAETKQTIEARFQLLESKLVTEIDRLDLFLNYHVDTLSDRLTPRIFAAPDGRFLIADDYTFVIPRDQLGLVAFLIAHKHRDIEAGVQRVIRDRLKEGETAIDVGANFGLHAVVMAATVGKQGKVVCFEPLPAVASALEETMALNDFSSRTSIIPRAVAENSGLRSFYESRHSPVSSFYPSPQPTTAQVSEISTVSLDDHFPPGSKIALVKIDAEGAEALVYAGMKRIISENPNLSIILEWSAGHFTRAGIPVRDFYQRLCQDGFRLRLIADTNVEPEAITNVDQIATIDSANVLLSRS